MGRAFEIAGKCVEEYFKECEKKDIDFDAAVADLHYVLLAVMFDVWNRKGGK